MKKVKLDKFSLVAVSIVFFCLCFVLVLIKLSITATAKEPDSFVYEIYYNEEVWENEVQACSTYEQQDTESFKTLDIPLEADVQEQIFNYCYDHSISPFLIFAMAYQESRFDYEIVGDSGNSIGLLQIQPRWHQERISRLEVVNLYEPMQNTKVAVDYLCELFTKRDDVFWVLHAYNGGETYANKLLAQDVVSNYAREIVNRSMQYEVAYEQN